MEDVDAFGTGYAPVEDATLISAIERNGHKLDLACELGLIKQTANGYEATINKGLTLAKKDEFGKLAGFEHYPSKDVMRLKEGIQQQGERKKETPIIKIETGVRPKASVQQAMMR